MFDLCRLILHVLSSESIRMIAILYLQSLQQVNANFQFIIVFYEFQNSLGLQCSLCSAGGRPSCCDDVERFENCTNIRPYTCDTKFRLMLRPYGSPIETAPLHGFPYYTRSNTGNSYHFPIGPHGFLTLPNPFNITDIGPWTVSEFHNSYTIMSCSAGHKRFDRYIYKSIIIVV